MELKLLRNQTRSVTKLISIVFLVTFSADNVYFHEVFHATFQFVSDLVFDRMDFKLRSLSEIASSCKSQFPTKKVLLTCFTSLSNNGIFFSTNLGMTGCSGELLYTDDQESQ